MRPPNRAAAIGLLALLAGLAASALAPSPRGVQQPALGTSRAAPGARRVVDTTAAGLLGSEGTLPRGTRAVVRTADAGATPAEPRPEPAPGLYTPYIAGPYTRVFVPRGTRYVNDHTLARGPDGVWHLYGITHTRTGAPQMERTFLHATARALTGPWTEQPDVLSAEPALNEQVLWAPCVFERVPGRWTMLAWGGFGPDERPQRGMRRADSTDLRTFARVEQRAPDPRRRVPGGRDPFVLRHGDRWLVYSVGSARVANTDHSRGQIIVTGTRDSLEDPAAVRWSPLSVVLEDPEPDMFWGNLESPFVVPYAGQFYLFVTRTAQGSHTDYTRTNVFRSPDPERFAWRPIAELFGHAAEVVQDGDRYFITTAGWTSYIGEDNRGVSIAPLQWARQ